MVLRNRSDSCRLSDKSSLSAAAKTPPGRDQVRGRADERLHPSGLKCGPSMTPKRAGRTTRMSAGFGVDTGQPCGGTAVLRARQGFKWW